jgi:hypothetical protein
MKHVLFADKSLLLSDAAAQTLIEYGAMLGRVRSADAVELQAITTEGDTVAVSFLLNGGSALVIETARSELSEPDNDDAIAYMRGRIDAYSYSPQPSDGPAEPVDEPA